MWVLAVASLVGIVALISNITTIAQLSGEADTLLTVRFTLSKIVNSGTVWGGLLIIGGWLVRRPVQAALAGVVAGGSALVVHYGLGRVVGAYQPDIWESNWIWFVAALIFGGPLGLIGATARRADLWALPARLVVPVAAVVEPFALGMFTPADLLPAPDRVSSAICGAVLIIAGIVGAAVVLVRWRRTRA